MARFTARKGLSAAVAVGLAALVGVAAPAAIAAEDKGGARVDSSRARQWNAFVDRLLAAHGVRLALEPTTKTEKIGGYAGLPGFYREEIYRTASPDRVIARVFWERENPENLNAIELYFHDAEGRLSVDYRAAYLARFRNAPIQTLINVHQHDADLHAFRQFDASGAIIYEQCRGDYFGDAVTLDLEEGFVPPPEEVPTELYVSCFGFLPLHADDFLDPMALVRPADGKSGDAPT